MKEPAIVGSILYGADKVVLDFVRQRLPGMEGRDFQKAVSLGVIRNGKLVGGVVYHDYRDLDGDIQLSAAFSTPLWCQRETVRDLFGYPFNQLGCSRITMLVRRSNKHARKFTEGLGLKLEGIVRKAYAGKEDIFVFGMLRDECKWIKAKTNG